MPATAIVYTSTTGNTQYAADLLHKEIGPLQADLIELPAVDITTLEMYRNLVCCVSTWGKGEMQDDWEAIAPRFSRLGLRDRKAAILGMGDQKNYPDAFADGVGHLARLLRSMGVVLIGKTSTDGYIFTRSRALEGNNFLALIIDEDNQHEQTMPRIRDWARQLRREFGM